MSAVGSILGYTAPSYVPPQVPAQVSAQVPSPAAGILQSAASSAAQTVVGAQTGMAQAIAAAQASAAQAIASAPAAGASTAAAVQAAAAQTVTNVQSAAGAKAAVKAAVTGTSGIAPLAPTVLAQLIAAQAAQPQTAAPQDPGLAAAASGTDAKTIFLNYQKETPAQRIEDSWLSSHHLTEKQLAAMSPADRDAIEKRMQAEVKERITQDSENKMTAKSVTLA